MQGAPTPANEPARRTVPVRLPYTRPLLTYILLAVITGVFAIQFLYIYINDVRVDPITVWGAQIYQQVLYQHEYYRLFTAMFLHINLAHLLLNGLALYAFGRSVEAFFGRVRFGLIYFLGGLSGAVGSFIFTQGNSVGASGAIFAIFGAEMVFLYMNRQILGKAATEQFRGLAILAVINFMIGFTTAAVPNAVTIDNWAHIGGFFAGIVLAWFICPQYKIVADPATPPGVRIDDATLKTQWWLPPLIFAVSLVGVMIYALSNLV